MSPFGQWSAFSLDRIPFVSFGDLPGIEDARGTVAMGWCPEKSQWLLPRLVFHTGRISATHLCATAVALILLFVRAKESDKV